MSWTLNIQTKSSGNHPISYATEDEAKPALERAREELKRASRDKVSGLATFEDKVVVPASDVTAITIRESGLGIA